MPALPLDSPDGADVHVADPDARVRLDIVYVRHLGLDSKRATAYSLNARQRNRVQTAFAATRQREARHQHAGGEAYPLGPHHGPPPGGTIIPVRPSAGLVAIGVSAARGGPGAASGGPCAGGTAAGGGALGSGCGGM